MEEKEEQDINVALMPPLSVNQTSTVILISIIWIFFNAN